MRCFMNYLTVEEFARKIKMCTHTVRRSIKQGRIYAMRPGIGSRSPYRIPESELERLQIENMYKTKKE
jgi:excisionase family DNA binding protein